MQVTGGDLSRTARVPLGRSFAAQSRWKPEVPCWRGSRRSA